MINPARKGHSVSMSDARVGSPEPSLVVIAPSPLGAIVEGSSDGEGRAAARHHLHDPAVAGRDREDSADPMGAADKRRLTSIVQEQFDFIWRSLRRLGVPVSEVDDCAQQVFWVASRKLASIAIGSERAFLFATALRVASDARRSRGRRREVPEDDADPPFDDAPRPDEIAEQRRARAVLDEVLAAMPMELRAVFVLFELEEMSTAEIATLLEIPTGTVASRLRRAREEFQCLVGRMQAKSATERARAFGGSR